MSLPSLWDPPGVLHALWVPAWTPIPCVASCHGGLEDHGLREPKSHGEAGCEGGQGRARALVWGHSRPWGGGFVFRCRQQESLLLLQPLKSQTPRPPFLPDSCLPARASGAAQLNDHRARPSAPQAGARSRGSRLTTRPARPGGPAPRAPTAAPSGAGPGCTPRPPRVSQEATSRPRPHDRRLPGRGEARVPGKAAAHGEAVSPERPGA